MASESGHDNNNVVFRLHKLIKSGNLTDFKTLVRNRSLEERRLIVNQKLEHNTALFLACFLGKLGIVKYLLDYCQPDLEITGIHVVEEDERSEHIVPPLWSAAISGKLDIAKVLIEKGADINGCSDTKSTAVRAACYSNNIAMVKFLVKHGADINIPNKKGATCLMNAIECKELCEFLIASGADVNAQETGRDRLTALHYAVNYQKLDSIKVLLKHGADVNLKTTDGTSPVLLAALLNLKEITNFFIKDETLPVSICDRINAVELLGAKSVDYHSRFQDAMNWWHEGLVMRDAYQVPKILPSPREIYGNAKEFESTEELSNLHDVSSENMFLQSALVKERILGPLNQDSLLGAIQYGWGLRNSGKYQLALKIIHYCYDGYLSKEWYLLDNCLISASQILNLTVLLLKEGKEEGTDEYFENMLKFFHSFIDHTIKATPLLEEKPSLKDEKRNYQQLLLLVLDCISLLYHILPDDSRIHEIYSEVRKIVRFDPRGLNKQTLLHIAVDPCTTKRLYENLLDWIKPGVDVVHILLECGAHVNSVDVNQNSPLFCHLSMYSGLDYVPDRDSEILKLLLEFGAHVDMCNKSGLSPLDVAKQHDVVLHEVKHRKLQCLAASVIVQNCLPYRSEIPGNLVGFVEIHGKQPNVR